MPGNAQQNLYMKIDTSTTAWKIADDIVSYIAQTPSSELSDANIAGLTPAIKRIVLSGISSMPDAYEELQAAREAGKTIQFKPDHFMPWEDILPHQSLSARDPSAYRIKPQFQLPEKRPYSKESWNFEWVKPVNGNRDVRVLAIDETQIYSHFGANTFEELMRGYVGSNDRVTWTELYR